MQIIGFDPGSRFFGIGLLGKNGNKINYIDSELIVLKEKDIYERFKKLWNDLETLFDRIGLEEANTFAAIEEGFVGKNIKSADTLAKIRGLVTGFCISRNIELISYSPREIKKALTGNGNAEKGQVADMLKRLLNIEIESLKDDETDALAVAYCHALSLKRSA